MAAGEVSLEGMSEGDVRNLAALSQLLLNDPKTRKGAMRLIKEVRPEFTAPELEIEGVAAEVSKTVDAKLGEHLKRVEGLEKNLTDRDAKEQERLAREQWDKLKQAPIQAGLITEAELPALEEFMKTEGFNNTQYLQAAKYRKSMQAVAAPTVAPINHFTMPDQKDLRNNPKRFFREQTAQGIKESAARKLTGTFGLGPAS